MEAYWPTIPPEPPPTGNFRLSSTRMDDNNKQNERKQNKKKNQQCILKKMTLKKIDRSLKDC